MSHFTVMVFGDDVEDQLQPFHEYECTGINDEYVIDEDVTEELQERIVDGDSLEESLDWYGLSNKIVSDESEVDSEGDGEHKYGYAIVKDGVLVKAVNRTNPDRKWDWYQIGGRWSGFLKLKEGAIGENGQRSWMSREEEIPSTHCDSALKGDIDIEGIRNDVGNDAGKEWDKVHEVVGDSTWETWDSVRNRMNIDEAREFYNNQEPVKKLRERNDVGNWYSGNDGFLVSREEFVSQARSRAISTFAVLKDGVWYEKGEMGWFGISDDNMEQSDWDAEVGKLIDSVSDDTRITIVDCHI